MWRWCDERWERLTVIRAILSAFRGYYQEHLSAWNILFSAGAALCCSADSLCCRNNKIRPGKALNTVLNIRLGFQRYESQESRKHSPALPCWRSKYSVPVVTLAVRESQKCNMTGNAFIILHCISQWSFIITARVSSPQRNWTLDYTRLGIKVWAVFG